MTLSTMTLSIMTLSITTLSIMTLNISAKYNCSILSMTPGANVVKHLLQ
jgi:hypothetical protein